MQLLQTPDKDQETAIDAAILLKSSRSLCGICMVQGSSYTCPRCNLPYCSLSCYKSDMHADCTEAFYKSNFVNELHSNRVSDADRLHMLRILDEHEKAALNEEQQAFENVPSTSTINKMTDCLSDIDLDTASVKDILSRLPPQEVERFNLIIKNKDAAMLLLPDWKPWWNAKVHGNSIIDIEETYDDGIPLLLETKQISTITKVKPNARLVFSILDIIIAYVYVCRTLNGDVFESCSESFFLVTQASYIFDASCSCKFVFESPKEVVSTLSSRLLAHCDLSPKGVMAILSDACKIIQSRLFIVAALSDLHRMVSNVPKNSRANSISQKIYFFACLANDAALQKEFQLDALFKECRVCLETEIDRLYAFEKTASDLQKAIKDADIQQNRRLIQEME
ncbi:hypothetical protein QVD99_001773 [Batrachochytrium dendrobatidis]|nr:hypothetical protein QVD99_001773 [Batrachochytrium dendrobatidis]